LALVAALMLVSSLAAEQDFCPFTTCDDEATEVERWMCFGRQLFAPISMGNHTSRKVALKKTRFVEHDCGGVGWGNSIRGLYNTAAIAAVLGRRLIVSHSAFNRVFLPPNDTVTSWDYGLSALLSATGGQMAAYEAREYFDFEMHGRSPNRFAVWTKSLQDKPDKVSYKKQVLVGGICGGERELVTTGGCISRIMPKYVECLNDNQKGYFGDNLMSIPFFHYLFQRPGEIMVSTLAQIRERLGLGGAPDGEPTPGAWGLRTPGYYILALHFRRVPVGFEPLSFELNEKKSLEYRLTTLRAFWTHAEKAAKAAQEIAACRKQKLLIYFATDDVKNLRPEAIKRLGSYGQVAFGLGEEEVGHMSPQWTNNDLDKLKAVEAKIKQARGTPEPDAALVEVQVEVDTHVHGKTLIKIEDHIADVQRESQITTEMHGNMAIVEWWILAHANWLVGHSGTSFSETASGVGLGPMGIMERFDMVHSPDHASASLRRDWHGDGCSPVRAADPEEAKACPNMGPSKI